MNFFKIKIVEIIREVEESYYSDYATAPDIQLSENFFRRVDLNVPDKYDFNTFVYNKMQQMKRSKKTIDYQI